MSWYGDWVPYVPVAQRRAKAVAYAAKLAKKEEARVVPGQGGRKENVQLVLGSGLVREP